ncbi:FAD binding domain-containing protein [Thermopolyspora sp. NPDC052614]|uniref:FAD binding domain-containing protein n=1 Tax=Thermopolyspora sp. NPDC052614 TaxID=3155682 RepID=UPI00343A2E0D
MTLRELSETLAADGGEPRAGGTDVMARRGGGPYRDLRGFPELRGVTWDADGSARLGALTTIAEIAGDARLAAAYPALTLTAGALATPQIRAVGTLGGNLLQRNRCAYFRHPGFSCLQKGGDACPARQGRHLHGTVIGDSACVAPHPSSMAMALLAYDGAVAEVSGRGEIPIAALYGDAPDRDHLLEPGEILTAVRLPPPLAGERAAYHRAIGRLKAEWPLVEAVARVALDGDVIAYAAVAVGGVARTPLRLPEVERALTGRSTTAGPTEAADLATERCAPLPETGYKVALLRGTVLEVLERAAG